VEEGAVMFFILSKTVAFLLLPSNFLVILGLVGPALMCTRWRRPGKWLAVASIVLLLVIGFLPVGQGLMYMLDNRFPAWDPTSARRTASSCSAELRERALQNTCLVPLARSVASDLTSSPIQWTGERGRVSD